MARINPAVSASQLMLDFIPGLAERHKSLKGCVRERVYSNPKPLKTIAADMDLSESELSRKLNDNPDDKRNLSCDDLEAYVMRTGDTTPIYYLVEKYCTDDQQRRSRAINQLASVLPDLLPLLKQAGVA